MIYRNTIEKSKLFGQFDRLTDFEEVTSAEVQQLKALVLDVANIVQEPMSNITLTFKQYTKHDLQHLLNIADHIHDFLPRKKKNKADGDKSIQLNAVELTYLWLAILLHDVGMFVSEADEKQQILNSKAYASHCRSHRDRLDAADEAEKFHNNIKAQSIRDAVFAEFIRQQHAERVHAFINKHLKDSGGDSKKDKLRFRDTDLSRDIGLLCESHNWGVRESRDSRKPDQCILKMKTADRVGKTRVNHRYLACCLRLGDILDFDRTRTPLSTFHSIHFTESISVSEWNKHLSIRGVTVSESLVEYVAECETPADYVAVQHFLNWVDRELQDAIWIVSEFPRDLADRYQLFLAPVVHRHQVKMANPRFVAGGFRFQLEYEQIMKLLMDKSLYPDETMFLRELLQNALDACRYQKARADDRGMANKYVPRIQVWDGSELLQNLETPDQGPRIIFQDNGVGMSLDQIENFFMRVGKSYYRSADFRAERERLADNGIHLNACSRFGIGFLSCFLGGDRIVVETFQYGSQPLRITIEGPSKYFVIEKLPDVNLVNFPAYSSPRDAASDSPPNYSGTKITVYLREYWHRNPSQNGRNLAFSSLEAYAVNQEIPLVVHRPNTEEKVIAARRWNSRMPSLPFQKKHAFWSELLVPSVFELSNYHELLQGRGSIWFFANHDRTPATQIGELRFEGEKINQSPFVAAVRKIIQSRNSGAVAALEVLRDVDERSNEEEEHAQDWLFESVYKFDDRDLEALLSGDLTWAIDMVEEVNATNQPYYDRLDEIAALSKGDLLVLAKYWRDEGCGDFDVSVPLLSIKSSYNLALFGIESPGGFQSWDAVKGSALRHNWLPEQRLHVSVDTYGTFSPEPAANRLFVPNERGNAVRGAVTMAFLKHAKSLAIENSGSKEWLDWFMNFLKSWGESSGLLPSQVREFARDLKSLPSLPDVPNELWINAAATHSTFGKIVFGRKGVCGEYLKVTDPISTYQIENAAKEAGVAPKQIDSEVQSLSDYLGWDITKGR